MRFAVLAGVAVLAGCGGSGGLPARGLAPFRIGATFPFTPAHQAPRSSPQLAYTGGVADSARGTYIVVADLATGRRRVVARLTGAIGSRSGFSMPSWSPDGRRLVFASSRAHRVRPGFGAGTHEWINGIYVVAVGGRGLHRVRGSRFVAHAEGISVGPVWTPDGRAVIGRARHGIALLPVRAGGRRAVSSGVSGGMYSPTARELLFEYAGGLRVVDLPSRSIHRILNDAAQPSWSPDGHQVVYTTNRDHHGDLPSGGDEPDAGKGLADEIYIADTDGTHQRRVTNTEASESQPRWSPDAKLIIFDTDYGAGILRPAQGALQVARPDGSCHTTLPIPASDDLVGGQGYEWRPGSDTSHIHLHCP